MPKRTYVIEWDKPEEAFWLPGDNVALALHAYCKNTKFTVTDIEGDPDLVHKINRICAAWNYADPKKRVTAEYLVEQILAISAGGITPPDDPKAFVLT